MSCNLNFLANLSGFSKKNLLEINGTFASSFIREYVMLIFLHQMWKLMNNFPCFQSTWTNLSSQTMCLLSTEKGAAVR